MRKIIVVLLVLPFVMTVANRCAGEAGWNEGVHLCACTVKARLDHGWGQNNVLSAYYAPDGTPTEEMIEQAEDGLKGIGCPVDAYYLFEPYSIEKLGLTLACMTGEARNGDKVVRSFRRDTLKNKGCFRG